VPPLLASDDQAQEIETILAEAFADPRARARREEVAARNGKLPADLRAILSELDAFIERFSERVEALGPPPVPVSRPEPRVEVLTPPDELPETTTVARDEFDAQGAPPLPPPRAPTPPPIPLAKAPPLSSEGGLIAPVPGDHPAVQLLHEDVLWLVSINDWGAALVSLERMLVMATITGKLKEFIDVNRAKLLDYYESKVLGPLDKVPTVATRTLDNVMPSGYLRSEKISAVLDLIDGERSLKAILKRSPYTPVETFAALHQLYRAGVIDV